MNVSLQTLHCFVFIYPQHYSLLIILVILEGVENFSAWYIIPQVWPNIRWLFIYLFKNGLLVGLTNFPT